MEISFSYVENLCKNIKKDWDQSLLDKSHPYIAGSIYASRLGEKCERYHYYSMQEKSEQFDIATLQRFEDGNLHETAIIRKFRELGYKIILEEMGSNIPIKNSKNELIGEIRGKIDGMIYKDHQKIPLEIKAYSTYLASGISEETDFLKSKYGIGAYYQIQSYLYQFGIPAGIIAMKNKNSGEPKFIPIKLDLSIMDNILKMAERVYTAKIKQNPSNLSRTVEYEKCLKCPFLAICKPDFSWGGEDGLKFLIETGEIDSLIDEKKELEIQKKPIEKRIKEVKEILEGGKKKIKGEKVIIPGIFTDMKENNLATEKYLIIRKILERKGYTVKDSTVISYNYDKIEK